MYPAIVAFVLLFAPLIAVMQTDGITTTLVDETAILYPGSDGTECFKVADGRLTLTASSPPGRTGETAYVELSVAAPADPMLVAPLTDEDLTATFPVTEGRYCFRLRVSKTLDDPFDPNRPERPNKQVHVKLVHRAT